MTSLVILYNTHFALPINPVCDSLCLFFFVVCMLLNFLFTLDIYVGQHLLTQILYKTRNIAGSVFSYFRNCRTENGASLVLLKAGGDSHFSIISSFVTDGGGADSSLLPNESSVSPICKIEAYF